MLAAGGVSTGSAPPKQRSHFHMRVSSGTDGEGGRERGRLGNKCEMGAKQLLKRMLLAAAGADPRQHLQA